MRKSSAMRDELDLIDISAKECGAGEYVAEHKKRKRNGAKERKTHKKSARCRKHRRKSKAARIGILYLIMILLTILLCFGVYHLVRWLGIGAGGRETASLSERKEIIRANDSAKPEITEDFLTVNPYSRPGEELPEVKNIFVHYTANRATSAAQNRSYFENLGLTGETSASAHFIIGYDGEIIQCIPLNEIGYAVKERNYDSISIECCYLSEDGKFTDATYQSLIKLCGWLLKEYDLIPEDMRRHYDVGGKKCPLYYVEHEDAWEQFLEDLRKYIS